MSDVSSDARHALRQMRRRPGFTTLVIAALGLGIGATSALLSVVYSLMLRPLPYDDEGRIRVFWRDYSWTDEEYDFLRERIRAFERIAVFSTDGATYATTANAGGAAQVLPLAVSSPTLFDVLGVHPMLGRAYDASDDRPGAAPVVVISYGLWRQDLGGDPAVIGRRLILNGTPATVIGVMPKGFFFPNPTTRAWRPLQLDPTQRDYQSGYLTVVARTRAGITDAQVDGEMRGLAAALGKRFTYPAAWDHSRGAVAIPVHTYVLGSVRTPLLLLLTAVALLFFIACANAAALILARTTDRATEMAVRAALGASPLRLARQLFVESLALALCAGVAGSLVAAGAFRMIVARLPLAGGLDTVTSVGSFTFLAAFALALIIAVIVSLAPLRHVLLGGRGVTRERSGPALQRGARRTHSSIIGAQVAFAVVLVVGATLLIRSVARLRQIDLGFDARGVTAFTVFAGSGIETATRAAVYRDLVSRVAALPGVTAAGLTNRLPVRDPGYQTSMIIEGRPDLAGARKPTALYRLATPGYLRAMGLRVVAGRAFDSTDVEGAAPAAIVSESFANAIWPGQSAIGKRVTDPWSGSPVQRTIVGVMRDARLTNVTGAPPLVLWVPSAQSPSTAGVLAVKSPAPAAMIIPAVRRAIAATDARLAIARVETMDDAIADAFAAPLRLRFFFTVFATLALVLGAIGVFGVVSYAVARRRPEFAVRMALGASPRVVRREVLAFGLAPVAAGIAVGSLAAAVGMQWVSAYLYGVAPRDAASFAAATSMILGAGVIAALGPALRAGRTNPADALRSVSS